MKGARVVTKVRHIWKIDSTPSQNLPNTSRRWTIMEIIALWVSRPTSSRSAICCRYINSQDLPNKWSQIQIFSVELTLTLNNFIPIHDNSRMAPENFILTRNTSKNFAFISWILSIYTKMIFFDSTFEVCCWGYRLDIFNLVNIFFTAYNVLSKITRTLFCFCWRNIAFENCWRIFCIL